MMTTPTTIQQPDTAQPKASPCASLDSVAILQGQAAVNRSRELFRLAGSSHHPSRDLRWLTVLRDGLQHQPYLLEVQPASDRPSYLPLAFVKSMLFGRYLVGLPYLNSGGVDSVHPETAQCLIDRAVGLAEQLNCRFLELRHETPVAHSAFNAELTSKVHMRLELPATPEALWDDLKSKVRNQIRKGQSQDFDIHWGTVDLLDDFYRVFSQNMRGPGNARLRTPAVFLHC